MFLLKTLRFLTLIEDLEEILHVLRDEPTIKVVRCEKARAMFASRACRKSVMIGMALSASQMKTVSIQSYHFAS